ncbi:MAG: hypothetical protein ACYC2R_11810 [Burkholderiales bacterium]
MKIDSSNLQLSSTHSATETNTRTETLRAWIGNRRPDFEGNNPHPPAAANDPVSLSAQALAAQASQAVPADSSAAAKDPKLQLLILLLERLTGKKFQFIRPEDLTALDPAAQKLLDQANQAAQQAQSGGQAPQPAGWGIEYDAHASHAESEQTTFSAQGSVRTQDGQEIKLDVSLNLSRQFATQQDISLRAGDAKTKDPLVVNFNGNAAQLTQTKFGFDLGSDGRKEQISFVAPGSGFLALDKNGDGTVNNGSELFGAKTGDGFSELAAYDSNKNNWIDENDPIFSKLSIWTKDAQGKDQLTSLAQAGIGAIYLGHVSSEFSLKDAQNNLDGQVRSSGIYLNENGTAGTVQKIDLAV